EEALTFPLCLSAVTDDEHGGLPVRDVSVALGNLVLADHGRTVSARDPLVVPKPDQALTPAGAPAADPCQRAAFAPPPARSRPPPPPAPASPAPPARRAAHPARPPARPLRAGGRGRAPGPRRRPAGRPPQRGRQHLAAAARPARQRRLRP